MRNINLKDYKKIKDLDKDTVILEKGTNRIVLAKKDLTKDFIEPKEIVVRSFKKVVNGEIVTYDPKKEEFDKK